MPFKSSRQRRKVMAALRGRTMFGPPRSRELASIITIRDPKATEASLGELRRLVREGRYSPARVKKSLVLAANRARVIAKNPRVSQNQALDMERSAAIYMREAGRL